MKEEIKQHEEIELNTEEIDKQTQIKELDSQIGIFTLKLAHLENKEKKLKDTFNSLKGGIENIYSALNCSQIASYELQSTTGVNISNILHYLKVIEKRKTDLIMSLSELMKIKEKNGEQMSMAPGINIMALASVIIMDDNAQNTQNKLFIKQKQSDCKEETATELLASGNIEEFRKKIEAKLKASPTKVEDI